VSGPWMRAHSPSIKSRGVRFSLLFNRFGSEQCISPMTPFCLKSIFLLWRPDEFKDHATIFGIFGQARNRVKGGVLCRRSEPLMRSAVCRIPFYRGEARCRCCVAAGEGSWCPVFQCAVRALKVVMIAPLRQPFLSLLQGAEPLNLQALIP
jgi:hypothetical protein